MKAITLHTNRLVLRTPSRGDAMSMCKYYNENLVFWRPWSPRFPHTIRFVPFHKEWVRIEQRQQKEGTHLRFYLYLKADEKREEIIGDVSFSQVVRGGFQSCFLGYKMAEKHTGSGYITEAIAEGVRFMFEDWNLHRIEANIMPKNEASIRVISKLGFAHEGEAKDYLQINNKWEDHIHFVKINKNWKPE